MELIFIFFTMLALQCLPGMIASLAFKLWKTVYYIVWELFLIRVALPLLKSTLKSLFWPFKIVFLEHPKMVIRDFKEAFSWLFNSYNTAIECEKQKLKREKRKNRLRKRLDSQSNNSSLSSERNTTELREPTPTTSSMEITDDLEVPTFLRKGIFHFVDGQLTKTNVKSLFSTADNTHKAADSVAKAANDIDEDILDMGYLSRPQKTLPQF